MTPEECILWELVRANRLGYHFRRQQIIDGYIADFYCHAAALVVEVDGQVHDDQVDYDARRTTAFAMRGIHVIRFRNDEVIASGGAIALQIAVECAAREKEPLPPTPSPKKGGGAEPEAAEAATSSVLSPSLLRGGVGEGFLPPRGPLLGVDYGTKRIGLAVCDPDRVIASPLDTLATGPGNDAYFASLVARSKFVGIVVGLPLHASGEESDMSRAARAFARRLAELTSLPAVMWDERYTSHAAEDALRGAKLTHKKRKAKVDRVAAQMILQAYLDAGCPPGGSDTTLHATDTEPDATAG